MANSEITDFKAGVDDAITALFKRVIQRGGDPAEMNRTLSIEALALAATLHCACEDGMTDDAVFVELAKTTIAQVRDDLGKTLS
jgi:hypothetical protein